MATMWESHSWVVVSPSEAIERWPIVNGLLMATVLRVYTWTDPSPFLRVYSLRPFLLSTCQYAPELQAAFPAAVIRARVHFGVPPFPSVVAGTPDPAGTILCT